VSKKEEKELLKLFKKIDTNQDGEISSQELKAAYSSMRGNNLSNQ